MEKNLISQEIERNKNFISKYGLEEFFSKSKYLSKPWETYKDKFNDFSSIISEVTPNKKDEIENELLLRPFKRFILPELKNNFEKYYINREIIIKKISIDLNGEHIKTINGEDFCLESITYGKKVNKYNILDHEVKKLIEDFFLLSHGFLIPFLKIFRKKNIINIEQLKEMEEKLNVRRFYDYRFMKRVKDIEKNEGLKQIDAILKTNREQKKWDESELLEYGKPTKFLLNIRDSYKAQKRNL